MFKLDSKTIEKRSDNLILFHQNVNRFSGKILDIELLTDKFSIDILCLCETWLKPEKMLFNINNFKVASVFNRVTAEGGGTLILCKNNLKFKDRSDITSSSVDRLCEVACAEIGSHLFLCVYRPPASNFSLFLTNMEEILRKIFKSNKLVFICGDFNIDTYIF